MQTLVKILRILATGIATVVSAAPSTAQTLTVSDVFERGETSSWTFESAGKTIGYHVSRYDGTVDLPGRKAHAFHGEVELLVQSPGGSLKQQFTGDLWTDELGRCLRFVLFARMVDVCSGVEINLLEGKGQARIFQGPTERKLELSTPTEVFLLANNFISHLELLLALRPVTAAAPSATFPMLSGNVLQNFPLKIDYRSEFEDEEAGEGGVVLEDSLGETLRVSASGRVTELSIPAQKVVMHRTEESFPPIRIDPPRPAAGPAFDFDLEPVMVSHGEVRLAGTISRRKGASGKAPAVFFVSGSGGQDRNGFSSGIDVGTHEILDRLTQEGFMVLRVDDRGVGESTGPTGDMGYRDLVDDARACVEHLASRPDVAPGRICVIGHSEGGMTAPILAAEMPDIAAIVLLAAPGRSIVPLLEEQLLWALEKQGTTKEAIDAEQKIYREFLERVTGDGSIDPATVREDLRVWIAARLWMQEHARIDPLANLQMVKCPVLLLHGARDIQVSAERDARVLLKALDDAGHRDHELVVFPELDHLFKKTTGPQSTAEDYLKSRPVDQEFLDTLAAWLKSRLL